MHIGCYENSLWNLTVYHQISFLFRRCGCHLIHSFLWTEIVRYFSVTVKTHKKNKGVEVPILVNACLMLLKLLLSSDASRANCATLISWALKSFVWHLFSEHLVHYGWFWRVSRCDFWPVYGGWCSCCSRWTKFSFPVTNGQFAKIHSLEFSSKVQPFLISVEHLIVEMKLLMLLLETIYDSTAMCS